MPNCPHCSSVYCKGDCKEIRAKIDEVFGPEIARRNAMPKKRNAGESLLQISYTSWWPVAFPMIFSWHTYNENSVNAIQGKIKKDRGVKAGIHDNLFVYPVRKFGSLELKDPEKLPSQNKYSDSQKGFAEVLDRCGWPHACCQNGSQIETYFRSLGLEPRIPFPRSLSSSKKQMRQFQVTDEMLRRD